MCSYEMTLKDLVRLEPPAEFRSEGKELQAMLVASGGPPWSVLLKLKRQVVS